MFEITIEETFAAGHALRNYRGKCENVHGHNYRCQVSVEGAELDEIGLLVDFVELKKVVHADMTVFVGAFVERLSSGKQAGEFPAAFDPDVVAQVIATYLQGLYRSALLCYDRARFEGQVDLFLTSLGL